MKISIELHFTGADDQNMEGEELKDSVYTLLGALMEHNCLIFEVEEEA
jgi:hypothetical protein